METPQEPTPVSFTVTVEPTAAPWQVQLALRTMEALVFESANVHFSDPNIPAAASTNEFMQQFHGCELTVHGNRNPFVWGGGTADEPLFTISDDAGTTNFSQSFWCPGDPANNGCSYLLEDSENGEFLAVDIL